MASGQIGGSPGVPRLDAAMVQSFDGPRLGKIDHPTTFSEVRHGQGPSRRAHSVGVATRVNESTGITDPGG